MIANAILGLFFVAILAFLGFASLVLAALVLAAIGILALEAQAGLQRFLADGLVLSPQDEEGLHFVLVGLIVVAPIILVALGISWIAGRFDKEARIRRAEEQLRKLRGE